ncbi:uncharacterized protein [Primulina eburnea]|uniref:uncharacterized protein n=1 Tax=Primulina eburnea TaxID=1245227 RepID=UPI003C6BDB34
MDNGDIDAIFKMQRHLREHIEMLQYEFNKLVLNAEVAGRLQQAKTVVSDRITRCLQAYTQLWNGENSEHKAKWTKKRTTMSMPPGRCCMLRSHNSDLLIFDPEIERTTRKLRKARREEIQAMAEHRENDRHTQPEAIPIRDHFRPVINNHYSGIARGTINANNFELKPALINMVQQNQFAGTATSDPHVHLRTFLEITDTELATKFLSKYFPPAKSAQLKIELSTFRQTDFEQLYEAWERYKELLWRCPNHGFEDWVQIELFCNGLNGQTRTTVDAAAGGTIFAKSPAQAYDLLEQMTINSYQWPSERSGVQKTAGIYTVDPITSLTAQVSTLTTQIATMNKVSTSNTEGPSPVVEEAHFLEEAQYINNRNVGGFGGYRVGQISKQLTSQPSDAVQKNADPNLREVNAIFMQHEEIGVISKEEKVDQPTPSKRNRGKKGKSYDFDQRVDISLLPYPQRFLQLKAEFQKKKSLEDLKNLHSNIQSAEQEEVAFTGGDDKGRKENLPQKLQDPGEFVVPCEIGSQSVKKAICDSGASVNIMPSFLYEKLGLSRIKPTRLSLQMADKSVRTPLGIVEDVELKIEKIRLLADFVVLDMGNSQNVRAILGRPFLATAGAVIDLRQGKLNMAVDGQNIELKASKISYDPP